MARPSGRRTSQFHLPQASPQPEVPSLENNFVGGLKTEYTGLNFPENACTATTNCRFTRTGNVLRRNGFNYESNFTTNTVNRTGSAISTYVWTNAGGTGNQEILVTQIGGTLFFYLVSNATISTSASSTLLGSTVALSTFQVSGSPNAVECQYTAGNGYLFVFNSNCNPFFCTFDGISNVTASGITLQIRDFNGYYPEPGNPAITNRPNSLTIEHEYNLLNQGWTTTPAWTASSTQAGASSIIWTGGGATGWLIVSPGINSFTVASGIVGISPGQAMNLSWNAAVTGPASTASGQATGTVVSYSGTTLVVSILTNTENSSNFYSSLPTGWSNAHFTIGSGANASNTINGWFNILSTYPSNTDIWFEYKNANGFFDPTTTFGNVVPSTSAAPKGYFILNAFNQNQTGISGVPGLTNISTNSRPRTGAWFQGRVWYAGVDASQPAFGDAAFYTWTENIYFSQIITNTNQFGLCYQNNDPTAETLNTILPTDGGVIQIQGCGSIYKLFPVVNGLLVFAANGIWFITGSSGIGFSATDFTVSKVSGEHAISGTSFIDIQGWPIFWNSDGIYMVSPGQSYTSGQTALQVQNITLPSIKKFFQSIPISSKLFARGSYNHITGEVQWVYRSTTETDVTSRYSFDSALVYLTYTQAFYTWVIGSGSNVHSADYIEFTGSTPSTAPNPTFKYLTSTPSSGSYNFTFSEERDNVIFKDWNSITPVDFTSSFQTAYRLKGQAQRKAQPEYIWLYSDIPTSSYTIQGVFDYAINTSSGRFSSVQTVTSFNPLLYGKNIRRHRLRGNGYVCQFIVGSVSGNPFNFGGWAVLDTIGIQ